MPCWCFRRSSVLNRLLLWNKFIRISDLAEVARESLLPSSDLQGGYIYDVYPLEYIPTISIQKRLLYELTIESRSRSSINLHELNHNQQGLGYLDWQKYRVGWVPRGYHERAAGYLYSVYRCDPCGPDHRV